MAPKSILPLSLLLTETLAAGGLYSSYVGLSIELIGFPTFAGTKAAPNQYSYNLMKTLGDVQGGPVIVRVGGNSADRAIYDKTMVNATATSCPNADPTAVQCIGKTFFDSYGAFPEGTVYSHNFNLGAWTQPGFDTLTATVPMACNALRGQLMTWELGNEPDLFIGSKRPSTYATPQYASEWVNMTQRFEALLEQSCPDMMGDLAYMTPSLSSPGSRLHLVDILNDEGVQSIGNIRQLSVHNYMDGAQNPGVTLQKTLMSHTAVSNSIKKHVNYAATASGASGLDADYVIGEHNSLYGGGASGLSDVFGAALWGMDFSLSAASTGVIKRVHFHQAVGSPYAAWQPDGRIMTNPAYYGKLAAGTFLANSDTLDVRVLSLNGDADKDSGYGAYVDGKLERIAAINFRQYVSSSGTRGSQIYKVEVDAGSQWTGKRLTAAQATDKTGVTFNGFSYEASSNGLPVRASSRTSSEVLKADASGVLSIIVSDSEAIVLERQ